MPQLDGLGMSHLYATLTERLAAQPQARVFDVVQDRTIRVSWKTEVLAGLQAAFSGAARKPILDELLAIHKAACCESRVFVALHMHAGDGNVHTNIPVNSDNYEMLQDAHEAVARIMTLARSLDGVISGEHGIGITKLEFLTEDELAPNSRPTSAASTRKAASTRASCCHGADLRNAYTPSFGLMGHESLIMQQSDIGAITDSIKDCLRCGKCKPVCATHVPRANLLYSPRNKILATSLLVEAFLYEEQTRRGVSIKHWEEFEDVADHCTVCHKCVKPCPVKIDFGDVTMNMRNLLRKMGKKKFNPGTAAPMFFLNATNPETINAARKAMVGVGYKAQRVANDLLTGLVKKQTSAPPATVGKPPLREQVIHFINKKMPGGLPKKTARALLDIEDTNYVPIIRNPKATTADAEAVFYFPGCGSERLFSQVGLATQAMLWHAGVQTVLPPGYLCCGYPQRGSGQFDKAEKIITDNRVLFHRVANTLNYLDIKTVVVSCGTCYDQLAGYEFEKIFPGCRLIGHPRVPAGEGHQARWRQGRALHVSRPLPHADEAAGSDEDGASAGGRRRGQERALLRRVGHAGRHPAGRLDAGALPQGRGTAQGRGRAAQRWLGQGRETLKILTSCPSCLQGLWRYQGDLQTGMLEADYIVVEMARQILGEGWMAEYVRQAPTRAGSSACWCKRRRCGVRTQRPAVTPGVLLWVDCCGLP